jgi:uncharacterized protein
MEKIIGREIEKDILKKILESPQPEFVAVYGRRRVGKTYLIKQFFDNQFAFYMTGTANVNMAQQLNNFYVAYNHYSKKPLEQTPKNWFEAFENLRKLLENSTLTTKVIFIDELPWLDTPRANFVAALEYFWNSYGSSQGNLKLIVCGSAASWMINKLINNRGGLHNRITKRIPLKPFTLKEVEVYLQAKQIYLERYQILQIYSVMGGIPYYLNELETGLSSFQNIDKICFSEAGLLRTEYQELFYSLFQEAPNYLVIIEALSNKAKGLTRDEIIKTSNISNGGTISKVLEELEVSGFIKKYLPFDKKSKSSLYQLTDPYSLFYHKFIKDSKAIGENTWINLMDSSKYRAWSGYAFEYVCMSHIENIKKSLSIQGVYSEISSWVSRNAEKGTQIDLLIDRKDNVITVCEIKFSNDEYEITKSYANDLRNKLNLFKSESKTRKTLFLAMITTFGVKTNQYSLGLVQNFITMDALFE